MSNTTHAFTNKCLMNTDNIIMFTCRYKKQYINSFRVLVQTDFFLIADVAKGIYISYMCVTVMWKMIALLCCGGTSLAFQCMLFWFLYWCILLAYLPASPFDYISERCVTIAAFGFMDFL